MSNAPNWAQVISAIGGLAGFTALGLEIWTRWSRRRLPPDDLLANLLALQGWFSEIVAHGGKRATWFLESERRRQEDLLAIANGQIVDDDLNSLVGDARARYHDAWAASSDTPQQIQMQMEAAEKGRGSCVHAINRANELIRKYRK